MSIFSNIFRKAENKELPDYMLEIVEYLGCECEYIDSDISIDDLMNLYLKSREDGTKFGFTPVIVVGDAVIVDALDIGTNSIEEVQRVRSELLFGDCSGGESLLRDAFNLHKENYMEYNSESGLEKLYGEYQGQQSPDKSFHISYSFKIGVKNNKERLILAKIPTDKPWEIFAWLPFGGWNDCPDAEDMISACKYWYDKYGAVPAVISHDTLEMYLTEPVASMDTALKIAEEQYGFCADIVDQGTRTIKALAESLADSNIWFFWWD